MKCLKEFWVEKNIVSGCQVFFWIYIIEKKIEINAALLVLWKLIFIHIKYVYGLHPDKQINTSHLGTSHGVLVVKNMLANEGDVRFTVLFPCREDPLEKGMAAHSSVLAWRSPYTEEPGGLQSRVTKSRTRLKWLSVRAHTVIQYRKKINS